MTSCAGTCVSTLSDAQNCGACGTICGAGMVCSGGTCKTDMHLGCDDSTQTLCSGVCVSLKTDDDNCGTCGRICTAPLKCTSGVCLDPCLPKTTCTGATMCIDLTTDVANCGACGSACASGMVCAAGTCRLQCPSDMSDECPATGTPTFCTDLTTDASNCGACGTTCNTAGGEICSGSLCRCPSTMSNVCSGQCVNEQSDPNHCGGCANVCETGAQCITGTCTCPSSAPNSCPATGTPTYCANLQTDVANCGTCAATCDTSMGKECITGSCVCPGVTPMVCSGQCTDLSKDVNHCGNCTNVCGSGTPYCISGVCMTLPPVPQWERILTETSIIFGPSAVLLSGKIYYFGGGTSASSYVNTLSLFDPSLNSWRVLAPTGTAPSGRIRSMMAVVGSKIYLFGGLAIGTSFQGDLWVYDPSSAGDGSWTQITNATGTGPSARCWGTAATMGGKMYIFGGANWSGAGRFNDLHAYDPVANSWQALSPAGTAPSARDDTTATILNGKMYIFGGENNFTNYGGLYVYDPSTGTDGTWSSLSPQGVTEGVRAGHAATVLDGKLIMTGGGASTAYTDTQMYDPGVGGDGTWSTLTTQCNLPPARGEFSAITVGEVIYTYGGGVTGVYSLKYAPPCSSCSCGGVCINGATDTMNCGGCGVVCSGGTPHCTSSVCSP